MTPTRALAFVREHGVVLEAGTGPVPSLAQEIVGAPIRGSWWAHPRSQEIFGLTRAVRGSEEVLVCRLVEGKVTYVHRRLWPALVRAAKRFPKKRLARIRESHTAAGRHVTEEVELSKWVPAAIVTQASKLSEERALAELGPWCA
jgi:hypothetical protein